jgi:tRNA (mo5U34)-methyltransferase
MDLNSIRSERERWLGWKNIAPLRERLRNLPKIEELFVEIGDIVKIEGDIDKRDREFIKSVALELKPWRKGPFELFGTFIDSEWQSFIKYNLLKEHIDLSDRLVADVGCNNGYYMFRFLEQKPKKIVGFDPSPLFKTQFDFINHFIKSDIIYELLGIEHLEFYEEKFDTIFCLGVLYHRSDPISSLKSLKKALNHKGEVILDTFMIDGEEEVALTPKNRYSKIPNIYFIPTIPALENWCERAGFSEVEILEVKKTDLFEQRKTEWIDGESLDNFLDKDDRNYTVEGYPAPKRVYIRAKL